MEVTIQSTSKIVELDGVLVRVWEGITSTGIPVHCFITRIAVNNDENQAQFQQELTECRTPSADIQAFPLRLIL
jgi:hypothetical protein